MCRFTGQRMPNILSRAKTKGDRERSGARTWTPRDESPGDALARIQVRSPSVRLLKPCARRYFFTVTVVVLVEALPLASLHCTVIV